LPTVIDSLIVRLGLDSKGLDSQAPAGTKKIKDIEVQAGKTERSVDSLTRTLGSFLALIGGTAALKSFVEDTIASNAALDRFSKNLGMSVSDVSAWGNAVEGVGGSAKSLHGTMDMLSKAQTEFALTGQSSLIPYFAALGVSLGTVGKQARPVDEILLDLADRFSGMDRTTANNMGRMMGLDQDTLNLLLQGRREVELTIKRQKEYNAVTKAQAEESSKLQRSMVDLRQSFAAVGRDLLQQASPVIEKFLGLLRDFGGWVRENKEFVSEFLTIMAVGLGAVALAALPITGTVAAVTALAAAIALLYQDYQTWKRGGDSLIDWGKWEPAITAATKGVHALAEGIDKLAESYKNYYEKKTGHKFSVGGFIEDTKAIFGVADTTNTAAMGKGSIADRAKAQAARVSAKTGIPADIIWAQWAHETGNFTNRGAKDLNNLAGVNVPGGKGQDYRKFNSLDDFGNYYAYLMRPGGFYPGASKAKTPEDFAAALKAGGYYTGAQSDYASDLRAWDSRYLKDARGAGGGGSSADNRTTVTTGDITVHTQATDANGIARDIGKSMNDYLFTSQATAGLF
jgi:hypothetical protein